MTITPATILGLAGVELDPGDYARRASPLDLGGLSALTVMVPFKPSSPIAAGSLYKVGALSGAGDPYGLGPTYSENATILVQTGGVGSFVQKAAGVELKAGNNADVTNGEVVLWWHDPATAPWTLALDYTNLDAIDPGTTRGVFCQLLVGCVGIGTGGIEVNPNQWSGTDLADLGDSALAAKLNGWRFSWNTITPTEGNRDEIRLRQFKDGVVQPALDPVGGGDPTWTFKSGIRYRLTFAYLSGTITCTKTAPGEPTEIVKYTAAIGTGWMGLKVANGRRGLFENSTMGASVGADDVNQAVLASAGLAVGFTVAAGASLGTSTTGLVPGQESLLMLGFGDGLPIAFLDELQLTLSGAAARSGGLVVGGTDDELMGGAPGVYGPHEVWPRKPTKTWCSLRSRMLRNSADVVGIGAEETFSGAPSAVAMPVQADVQAPGPVDIDVLAEAYNPDPTTAASLVSVGPGEHGTYSVAGQRARVVPEPGYEGVARAPYVIRRGLKDSSGRLLMEMAKEIIVTPPTGIYPHGPWRRSPPAPTSGPTYKPVSTLDDLKRELSTAQGGDHVVVKGDINLNGKLVIDRAVSSLDQFYLRGDTEAEGGFRRLYGGNIEFRGTKQATIRDLHLDGVRLKWYEASKVQVECLRVTGIIGDPDRSVDGNCYTGMWSFISRDKPSDPATNVHNNLVGFIHYELCKATLFDIGQQEEPTRFVMTHIFADRRGGASKMYQPGRNPGNGQHDTMNYLQYSLDKGTDNQTDWCELKHNGTWIRHMTVHMSSTDGPAPQQTKIRHGRIESGSASILTARGNVMEAILYIQDGYGNAPSITVRGIHHRVFNCEVRKPDGSRGNGVIEFFRGNRNPYTFPADSGEPSGTACRSVGAAKCVAAGNYGFTVKDHDSVGTSCSEPDFKPNGYPPDQCWVPTSGKTANTAFASSGFTNTNTTPWPDDTAYPDADNTKRLTQLLPANVGPSAYRTAFNP